MLLAVIPWEIENDRGKMIKEFTSKEQDQQFKDWHAQNLDSFYLNERGKSEVMLHKVDCFHHGSGEGFSSTTNFKIGSGSRKELEAWAKNKNYKVVSCGHCKP